MSLREQNIYFLEKRLPFLASLFFSFCIILGAGFLVGYNSFTKAKDAAIRSNSTDATLSSKLILEHQRAALGVLRSYIRQPLFIDSIKRKDFEGVAKHLSDLVKNNPEVEWPFIANPDSTIWVNFPVDKRVFGKDLSARDWYKGVSREWKPYISSVYKMVVGDQDLAVSVNMPIFDEKEKVIGILGVAQSTSFFRKLFDEMIANSEIYLTLIDQEGHIVYSNRFPYSKKVIDYPPLDFVAKAKRGERGNVEIQDPSDENRTKYFSFAPVEGIGWSVIVEKGKREVLRSEYSYFGMIGGISFLMFAVVVLSLNHLRSRHGQIRALEEVNRELDGRVRERTADLEIAIQKLNGEISDRKRAEQELRENEQRYRSLFEHMLDGFAYCQMLYDAHGRPDDFVYLAVNDAFGRLTGLKDVIDKRVTQIIPRIKELNPELFEIYGRVASTANPERFEIDFKPLNLHLSVSVYSPAKGRFVAVFDNIAERKKAEEALRKAKDELELRVQERTEELAKSQQRLQQLASQLLLAQEKERKRVAVELHDGLLSELAATKYLLEGKVMQLDRGKPVEPGELRRVADILAGTMKEARRLMNNLHPSILDELGLIATINWLCGEYQKSYPHITVEKEIALSEKDIAAGVRVVIYRVLQEALNNFARHGKGNRVALSLLKSDGTFALAIQDNGQGFDLENAQKGLGLESMRERVELSGGKFQLESAIGQGTIIRAVWST